MKFTGEELRQLCRNDGGQFNCSNIIEADNFCKKLTLGHYENFPVGSLLLPKTKRHHIYAIYSFARVADDIADETSISEKKEKLELLNKFSELLSFTNDNSNPIFLSLNRTITELELPLEPFYKLISAFQQDVNFQQSTTLNELYDYCERSANPVGELVLRVFRLYNSKTAKYSDAICTGLQLANFWQDLSVDLKNNRCYIPSELLNKYEITSLDLLNKTNSTQLNRCLTELTEITENLFFEGEKLISKLKPFRLRFEIALTLAGGQRILQKIKKKEKNILEMRPKLNKFDYLSLTILSLYKTIVNK